MIKILCGLNVMQDVMRSEGRPYPTINGELPAEIGDFQSDQNLGKCSVRQCFSRLDKWQVWA
jgi:hypothetical protein